MPDTKLNRFEFLDLDFDAATVVVPSRAASEPEPQPVEPPPEPTLPISEVEARLAATRDEAYQAGLADGEARAVAAATQSLSRRQADVTARLLATAQALIAAEDARHAAAQADALAVAMSALSRVLPQAVAANRLGETEAVIRQTIAERIDEPRLVVRIPDLLLEPIRSMIDGWASQIGYDGRVIVLADEALGDDDCLIEWADGGTERRPADIIKDAMALAQSAGAGLAAVQARPVAAPPHAHLALHAATNLTA